MPKIVAIYHEAYNKFIPFLQNSFNSWVSSIVGAEAQKHLLQAAEWPKEQKEQQREYKQFLGLVAASREEKEIKVKPAEIKEIYSHNNRRQYPDSVLQSYDIWVKTAVSKPEYVTYHAALELDEKQYSQFLGFIDRVKPQGKPLSILEVAKVYRENQDTKPLPPEFTQFQLWVENSDIREEDRGVLSRVKNLRDENYGRFLKLMERSISQGELVDAEVKKIYLELSEKKEDSHLKYCYHAWIQSVANPTQFAIYSPLLKLSSADYAQFMGFVVAAQLLEEKSVTGVYGREDFKKCNPEIKSSFDLWVQKATGSEEKQIVWRESAELPAEEYNKYKYLVAKSRRDAKELNEKAIQEVYSKEYPALSIPLKKAYNRWIKKFVNKDKYDVYVLSQELEAKGYEEFQKLIFRSMPDGITIDEKAIKTIYEREYSTQPIPVQKAYTRWIRDYANVPGYEDYQAGLGLADDEYAELQGLISASTEEKGIRGVYASAYRTLEIAPRQVTVRGNPAAAKRIRDYFDKWVQGKLRNDPYDFLACSAAAKLELEKKEAFYKAHPEAKGDFKFDLTEEEREHFYGMVHSNYNYFKTAKEFFQNSYYKLSKSAKELYIKWIELAEKEKSEGREGFTEGEAKELFNIAAEQTYTFWEKINAKRETIEPWQRTTAYGLMFVGTALAMIFSLISPLNNLFTEIFGTVGRVNSLAFVGIVTTLAVAAIHLIHIAFFTKPNYYKLSENRLIYEPGETSSWRFVGKTWKAVFGFLLAVGLIGGFYTVASTAIFGALPFGDFLKLSLGYVSLPAQAALAIYSGLAILVTFIANGLKSTAISPSEIDQEEKSVGVQPQGGEFLDSAKGEAARAHEVVGSILQVEVKQDHFPRSPKRAFGSDADALTRMQGGPPQGMLLQGSSPEEKGKAEEKQKELLQKIPNEDLIKYVPVTPEVIRQLMPKGFTEEFIRGNFEGELHKRQREFLKKINDEVQKLPLPLLPGAVEDKSAEGVGTIRKLEDVKEEHLKVFIKSEKADADDEYLLPLDKREMFRTIFSEHIPPPPLP